MGKGKQFSKDECLAKCLERVAIFKEGGCEYILHLGLCTRHNNRGVKPGNDDSENICFIFSS